MPFQKQSHFVQITLHLSLAMTGIVTFHVRVSLMERLMFYNMHTIWEHELRFFSFLKIDLKPGAVA